MKEGRTTTADRGHHLLQAVTDPGPGHLGGAPGNAGQGFDDGLELFPVLAALDRLEGCADQFAAVFLQYTFLVQHDGCVERGLAAQGCQE